VPEAHSPQGDALTPAELEGLTLGPVVTRVDAERIAAFVEVTGDDPARWTDAAPPGYAAALLFRVAGPFLWDPRLAESRRTLLHVDQTFTHESPIARDAELAVTGRVDRVRERAGAFFVTFRAQAHRDAELVVESVSTFLMSATPAGDPGPDPGEPPAEARAAGVAMGDVATPEPGHRLVIDKSVSRADLVRYAAATDDFNPIHWDHEAARRAGVPGVIAHGLLLHAWLAQAAAAYSSSPAPIASIRTRFRNPLRPATPARLVAEPQTPEEVSVALLVGDERLATARAALRSGGD